MTQGFVQVAPDSTGKQLDNDVVVVPAGTVITDGSGNQTVLTSPAYYFRERIINADPNDPRGAATVTNSLTGPSGQDYGLTVRLPPGQDDLQYIAALLADIDQNIASLAGTFPMVGSAGPVQAANLAYPALGIDQSVVSPGVPRKLVCDIFGRAVVIPHASREAIQYANLTITSTTAAQTLIPAPASNIYSDLVAITAINTSATATELDISDGTQTVYLYVPAGDMRGIALGGVLIMNRSPGGAWTATTLTSVASVKIWASYVQNRTT